MLKVLEKVAQLFFILCIAHYVDSRQLPQGCTIFEQKFAFFNAVGSDLSGESHKFETILI